MVSIFLPSSLETFCKQAFTAFPSIMTVQAPQWPWLQPSFVPVKCKSSRRKRDKIRSGGTSLSTHLPLIRSFTCRLPFSFTLFPFLYPYYIPPSPPFSPGGGLGPLC